MEAFIPNQQVKDYIMSPNFILKQKKLSQGAKMLFISLCGFARSKNYCYPSLSKLACELGASINSIKNWLQQLISYNFVRRENTNGHNTYFLYEPTTSSENTSEEEDIVSNFDSQGVKICHDTMSNFDHKENKLNKIKEIPPLNPKGQKQEVQTDIQIREESEIFSFDDFWNAYPRKENKSKAKEAFLQAQKKKVLPFFKIYKTALEFFSQTPQWQRENGRYIPQLHNFIYDLRWEDVEKTPPPLSIPTENTQAYIAPIFAWKLQDKNTILQEDSTFDTAWKNFKRNFKTPKKEEETLAFVMFSKSYKQGKRLVVNGMQEMSILDYLQTKRRCE